MYSLCLSVYVCKCVRYRCTDWEHTRVSRGIVRSGWLCVLFGLYCLLVAVLHAATALWYAWEAPWAALTTLYVCVCTTLYVCVRVKAVHTSGDCGHSRVSRGIVHGG